MGRDTRRRCEWCPVPEGIRCRGEDVPRACRRADYRALFLRLATGEARRPDRPPARSPRFVAACDYRIPLARTRAEGSEGAPPGECSCTALCLAGRSTRADRLVGRECLAGCPHAGPLVD